MTDALGRCYVYGVVANSHDLDAVLGESGVKDASVTALVYRNIAAVISPLGSERVRRSRADLSAHEGVVEHVSASQTILPLQFGVVMPDEEAVVETFLAPQWEHFEAMIAALDGKHEYRLKARYVADVAIREVVETSAAIRRLQQRVRARSGAAGYHDRIRLGQLVAAELEQHKAEDAAEIVDRLGPYADSTVVLETRRDDVAVHAAFLVDDGARLRFDQALDALAADLNRRMTMELVGPLAPWDFVTVPEVSSRRTLAPVAGQGNS
jgi:hypothetical protein